MTNLHIPKPDLIIFGGSFDPPHKGHQDCIKYAKQNFPQAKFYVVPSFSPPLTKSSNKELRASFEDRLEMCRRAFGKLSDSVLDIERELSTPSYTLNMLKRVQKQFSNKNLGFLMGLDQLRNFSFWWQPLEILKIATNLT